MTWFRRVWARMRELFSSAAVEQDLSEELQSHLDHLTDEYVRRGFSRDDARRRALKHFGGSSGMEVAREAIRDSRGLPLLEHLVIDAKRGVRSLLRTRGFTTVAVLTLSLGIGVSTAVFSLLDHVVLRPLPYVDQHELVAIWEANTAPSNQAAASPQGSILTARDDANRMTVAPAAFVDFKARAAGFSGMAGYARDTRTLSGVDVPEQLVGEMVTTSYFSVLGASAARGRLLGPVDEQAASPKAIVISHAMWQTRFGADEQILGKPIRLNNELLEVVGVMSADFVPVSQFVQPDPVSYWVTEAFRPDLLTNYADHEINVVGRMAPGVALEAAQRALTAASEDIARRHPETNKDVRAFARPLADDIVRRVRTSLVVIAAMVGFILLIACVNVANLLIVRGASRRREIAIRYALGASRRRVLSELLTESVILSGVSCVGGVLVAAWLKGQLVALAPPTLPRLADVSLDARVLAFSVTTALVTGLIFGALPAWHARRTRPIDAMAAGGERVVSNRWMLRWRNGLMTFEVAVSMVLLIGAGLLVKSLLVLNQVDLGFRTNGVLAMNVNLPPQRYATGDSRLAFFQKLETRLRQVPGVVEVGYANRFPMRGAWESGFEIEGRPGPMISVPVQAVSPGFFKALDIRLLSGRTIADSDVPASEGAAVVSEAFSRKYLGGADPKGVRIRRAPTFPWITIVGVVTDIRRDGKKAAIDPQVFLPATQTQLYPARLADVAVLVDSHTAAGDGAGRIRAEMRRAVADVDPNQPIANVRSLDEVVSNSSRDQRFQALLLATFAVLALVLATIGVHGVVAYLVAQRTAEIGVRMALGAGRWTIVRWLLTATTFRVVTGAVLGLAAAALLSRYVTSLLFQVEPLDLATYVLSALLLCGVAIGAAMLAARRATTIDPVKALKAE